MEDGFKSEAQIDQSQVIAWIEFFQHPQFNYYNKIQELANLYPEEKSLMVDYWDLHKYNDEFAEALLKKPRERIPNAERAIWELCPADAKSNIHFRLRKIPSQTSRIELRDLRTLHLEKFIAVEGLVRSRSEVRPRIISAIFKCSRCGFEMVIPQDETVLKEPFVCGNESCGRAANATTFNLMKTTSEYLDMQILNIQESPEGLKDSAPPERLKIFLKDDLCGKVSPGERIIINGILFTSQRKISNQKTTDYDLFMEAFSLEQESTPYEEIQISAQEEAEIREMSQNPLIFELIRDSIAPSIFEMDTIKEALVLQLFGGVAKEEKTSHNRGDIHILLIGDPGTGKSQLLRYISKIAPRGVFASGKSASAAGLTATAVKDELDGRWTLEGGALVLADRGVACIDEIDKMKEEDRSSMHEAMEQQTISIAKAGITATLMTRCSILAAANPKLGRFDEGKPYPDQINLTPTLLSRFDLIFPITDKPEEHKDFHLAEQVLASHIAGEMRKNIEEKKAVDFNIDDAEAISRAKPPIEKELMQKYIAFAKRNSFPIMNQEVKDYLLNYYVQKRKGGLHKEGDEDKLDRVQITVRQLEGLIRLSEASARMRLSDRIEKSDCNRAINLFDWFLSKIAQDKGGKLDIDIIYTGTSARRTNYIKIIMETMREIQGNNDIDTSKGVHVSDLVRECKPKGIQESEVRDTLAKMSQAGELYSPSDDYYRISSR